MKNKLFCFLINNHFDFLIFFFVNIINFLKSIIYMFILILLLYISK
jgi:hypothetical protein